MRIGKRENVFTISSDKMFRRFCIMFYKSEMKHWGFHPIKEHEESRPYGIRLILPRFVLEYWF